MSAHQALRTSLTIAGATASDGGRTIRPAGDAPFRPPRPALPDIPRDLVARCQAHEAGAFDELFDGCRDYVYSVALGLCRDRQRAADVSQEVFLKLLRHIHRYRGDASFRTFLYRIVVNAAHDERRRLTARERFEDLAAARDQVAASAEPEVMYDRRREAARVRRALASLSPALRVTVVLRYVAGMSYEEMAVTLRLPTGTIGSRLSRALAQLGRVLARPGAPEVER